jgi:hypothetical protein
MLRWSMRLPVCVYVECVMWNVECVMWNVECARAAVFLGSPFLFWFAVLTVLGMSVEARIEGVY